MSVEALPEAGSGAALDPARFREVLGQYPTGVAVVTGVSPDGEPLGMTVGTFTSVSLAPPLVAFLPSRESSSWRALREAVSGFCVNVLADGQQHVGAQVAARKTGKFEGIGWRRSAAGNPVIDGCVAYIDCATEAVHDAGDHHIVIGRVRELDAPGDGAPLVFHQGGYGSVATGPAADSTARANVAGRPGGPALLRRLRPRRAEGPRA